MTTTPLPLEYDSQPQRHHQKGSRELHTIMVTLYDERTRKETAYAEQRGPFAVLYTDQGITISMKDDPLFPLLIDNHYILCFFNEGAALWFIDYILMPLYSPNILDCISSLLMSLWHKLITPWQDSGGEEPR